ncbi:MAG: glycosyltransferase, partial [Methanobacteriota archaeon]
MRARMPLQFVLFGLSLTSSWGNAHAATYRALVEGLSRKGHEVTFFERDVPWFAGRRDLAEPRYGRVVLYDRVSSLEADHRPAIDAADVLVVGSFVPDGREVGSLVLGRSSGARLFYDLDAPVTLMR